MIIKVIGLSRLAQSEELLQQANAENHGGQKLAVNWPAYQQAADAGMLCVGGVFDRDFLVGFVMVFKALDLFHGNFAANVVAVYLHPTYRKGFLGAKLIKFGEKLGKVMECSRIYFSVPCKIKRRTDLFITLGYTAKEVRLVKAL